MSFSTTACGDGISGLPKPRSTTSRPSRLRRRFSSSTVAKTYGGRSPTRRNSTLRGYNAGSEDDRVAAGLAESGAGSTPAEISCLRNRKNRAIFERRQKAYTGGLGGLGGSIKGGEDRMSRHVLVRRSSMAARVIRWAVPLAIACLALVGSSSGSASASAIQQP